MPFFFVRIYLFYYKFPNQPFNSVERRKVEEKKKDKTAKTNL